MASIYVHVPFCKRKCAYCDFYSTEGLEQVEPFLAALRTEIGERRALAEGTKFQTVYIGGGTPSLLSPDRLGGILETLDDHFCIAADAEVTVEANPGTATADGLRAIRRLGVNRISLGIQSLNDRALARLGRVHSAAEARDAFGWARLAGFENLSIDLIYAIPGQSPAEWEDTLRAALSLGPEHVSAYALTYEARTPLARTVPPEARTPADVEAAMQLTAVQLLALHGYERYEVSNFSRPGFRCGHNLAYWSHEPYLGFGPSAHSFWPAADSTRRWANARALSTYLERLGCGTLPVVLHEEVCPTDLLRERIFLQLRTGRLDLDRLMQDFGYDLRAERRAVVEGLLAEGLAMTDAESLHLTPAGFLVADEIAGRLLP